MIKKAGVEPQKIAVYVRNSSRVVSLEDRPALRKILEEADAKAVWAPGCPDFIASLRALASDKEPNRSPTRALHSRAQKED